MQSRIFLWKCSRAFLFALLFFSTSIDIADANTSHHHYFKKKAGICEEYVRGLYASQRYEFHKMHKAHLEVMTPLYREYEQLVERGSNDRRKKALEREINRRDRNFAKTVSARFGHTLVDGDKVIQHGRGNDSPCGDSGY